MPSLPQYHAISGTNAATVTAPDKEVARALAAVRWGVGTEAVLVRYVSNVFVGVEKGKAVART
jgi:hypothetical protein